MIANDLHETSEKWNHIANGYDKSVTPSHMWLANEGLRRVNLQSGMRFLDVASGSGALSIPAARLGAKVTSVDLSPVMLSLLEKRAKKEGLLVETQVMDGHDLQFQDNTFDVTGSQFGVMLFPDMPRALNGMARVTKPNGRVLMNVYGPPEKIEFFGFFVRAIQAAVPEFTGPSMDPPPLPFQLQNPQKLSNELEKAGLKDVHVETITEKLEFQSGQDLWFWLINSNPIAGAILTDLNLTNEQKDVIQLELENMVQQRSKGSDRAVLTNPINIGIGTK